MKKLAIYLLFAGIICLAVILGFRYLHRDNMPPESVPQAAKTPVAGQMGKTMVKTNPRIEPILETAQSVNVNSYTPEQARLRDFFQSGSTQQAVHQSTVSGR